MKLKHVDVSKEDWTDLIELIHCLDIEGTIWGADEKVAEYHNNLKKGDYISALEIIEADQVALTMGDCRVAVVIKSPAPHFKASLIYICTE